MGNTTPDADLVVGKRGQQPFWIDVKGQSGKNSWFVKSKPPSPSLFYVLVYLSPLATGDSIREADEFFILSQDDAAKLTADYLASHPGDRNLAQGFAFNDSHEFRNAWGKLPH
jgi:hypothetical protein